MKKYDIQLLIKPQCSYSCWKGLESDNEPKMVNDGVIKIDDVYYNALNIEEIIIVENDELLMKKIKI